MDFSDFFWLFSWKLNEHLVARWVPAQQLDQGAKTGTWQKHPKTETAMKSEIRKSKNRCRRNPRSFWHFVFSKYVYLFGRFYIEVLLILDFAYISDQTNIVKSKLLWLGSFKGSFWHTQSTYTIIYIHLYRHVRLNTTHWLVGMTEFFRVSLVPFDAQHKKDGVASSHWGCKFRWYNSCEGHSEDSGPCRFGWSLRACQCCKSWD